MDLALNEIQQMIKTNAREMLSRECPFDVVRAMEQDPDGYPRPLWRRMADMGWQGLAIPEQYSGAGGSFLDLALLMEEMGRAQAPGPFFSTVVLGGLTILDAGDEAMRAEVLPGVSSGEILMTLAVTEEGGGYGPDEVQLQARREGQEYILDGRKLFVPDAHVSDYVIVAARTSSAPDPKQGITLFLTPRETDGVGVTPHKTMAMERQSEVTFDSVRLPATSALGEVDGGWPALDRALQRAAAAKCVEMVGGAEAVLDMTVGYLKDRVQFGRPVGTFQGLQHHCANMAIDVEGSRYAAYQAAWRVSEGLPASREVSVAKAWVSDAYLRVCALAHQCHGAVGFTEEHNLQLYTRRARAQEQAYGDAGHHHRLLARRLREGETP